MTEQEALAIRAAILASNTCIDDSMAITAIDLFPHWTANLSVNVGERYKYNEVLYRVIQAHATQSDWTPDVVPALFTVVSVEVIPAWVQPLGSEDAYQIGDRVTHNGFEWESTSADNVFEPGVFGWVLI